MKIYLVGGAVRDALMGLPVQDHDWVVVGAAPQDLLDQGFRVVGVVPGVQQDPIVFVARDNQLYACRSFFVVRQMANQPQCLPVK